MSRSGSVRTRASRSWASAKSQGSTSARPTPRTSFFSFPIVVPAGGATSALVSATGIAAVTSDQVPWSLSLTHCQDTTAFNFLANLTGNTFYVSPVQTSSSSG
jgi:hypothetical protein